MAVRFRLNQSGVLELTNSARVVAYLDTAGDVVKQTVEAQSAGFAHTRHFSRSIRKTGVTKGATGPRITVFSTDWFAHGIEYGSINNPAYAPFRRACASLGLRVKGGGERR